MWSQNLPVTDEDSPHACKSSPACFNVCRASDATAGLLPPPPPGFTWVSDAVDDVISRKLPCMKPWVWPRHWNPSSPRCRPMTVRSCYRFLPFQNVDFSRCRGSGSGFLQSSWRKSWRQRMPDNTSVWSFYSPRFWLKWWSGWGLVIFSCLPLGGRRRSSLGWYITGRSFWHQTTGIQPMWHIFWISAPTSCLVVVLLITPDLRYEQIPPLTFLQK